MCYVKPMGFRIFSKIVITLGIVLVLVVSLEFLLLTLYEKEKDTNNVVKAAEESPGETKNDGLEFIKLVRENSKNVISSRKESSTEKYQIKNEEAKGASQSTIHVSAVVCGERTVEATTMLKSTTIFTNRTVQFHVLAEDQLHDEVKNIFHQWQTVQSGQVMFKLYSLQFPVGENADEWKKLFKPCAAQRLFLSDVLNPIDSVLYLDTDALVLRPVEDLWNHFKQFDNTQLASMAPEGEETSLSWYPRFARHPFVGKNGMNSGVMLMNLTRMRAFGWTEKILEAYHKYKLSITWGDQDLLNIVFHDHPGQLYVYSCDWNYRPDHCMYGNNCASAKDNGISVIHGNRGVYHNEKQVFFKAIYTALREFQPGDNIRILASHLADNLHAVSDPYCGAMVDSVLKYPNKMSQ